MLTAGQIDAYATNKATLFEMAAALPGAKVLDGRWGVDEVTSECVVQGAIARAGLRGVVPPESK